MNEGRVGRLEGCIQDTEEGDRQWVERGRGRQLPLYVSRGSFPVDSITHLSSLPDLGLCLGRNQLSRAR